MCEKGNQCINRVLQLAGELINLADEGDDVRNDVGCGILYGTIRDCAYKIRSLAQLELEAHQRCRDETHVEQH